MKAISGPGQHQQELQQQQQKKNKQHQRHRKEANGNADIANGNGNGHHQNHHHHHQRSQQPAKFVISRPIRAIMRDPLQLKVLVPRIGRSIEYQLSGALPPPNYNRQPSAPAIAANQPSSPQIRRLAHEAVQVSIQSQHESDCLSGHTHFDLVLRLQPQVRAAHFLCKVMYRNIREEVKEMGPYLLRVTEPVCCYRLEEMNCQLSAKTDHYHVYLALQLVSAEADCAACDGWFAATRGDQQPDGGNGDLTTATGGRSRRQSESSCASVTMEEQSLAMQPTGAQLPDFGTRWSPLATLKITTDSAEADGPLYCSPHLLCLCSEKFRELLAASSSSGSTGELVLPGTPHSELLLLLQLTHPGTPCTVNLTNVLQVLRLAARFRVPHLRRTADQLLCRSLHAGAPVSNVRRVELGGLAAQFGLSELAELLRIDRA